MAGKIADAYHRCQRTKNIDEATRAAIHGAFHAAIQGAIHAAAQNAAITLV